MEIDFQFKSHGGYKLNESEKIDTGRELTMEEPTSALRRLKKARTPGCDGLPPELYLEVRDSIKEVFLMLLNML